MAKPPREMCLQGSTDVKIWITSLNSHSATFQPAATYSFLSTTAPLWYPASALGKPGRKGDEKMRLTATVATLTILVVLFAGMASASEAESGNELYELLASKSPYSRFVGQGYILGVIDTTHSLNRVWHLPVQWTLPPKVKKRQIFDAVKQYLAKHPEDRNQNAYFLVNKALGRAFPPEK